MPAQLSKLHVRFIQTQNSFSLQNNSNINANGLGIEQLYIKDNSSFYFINLGSSLQSDTSLSMIFKESNDYLSALQCSVSTQIIQKGSDAYEEALLFFQVNEAAVKELFLFSIEDIKES